MLRTDAQVSAQVAVEAVVNDFHSYDVTTARIVFDNGLENGVPNLYLNLLAELLGH